MITKRLSNDRGHGNHGWLISHFSFSFADYYDPAHMHFRSLRVINEDVIQANSGFPTHPHDNMEIITYVVSGELGHKDSTGGEGVIKRGDVQTMTAGSGIRHSEFNPSQTQDCHLLQIWILPGEKNLQPSYNQKNFPEADKRNQLRLLVSPNAEDGSLLIHQDTRLYASILDIDQTVELSLAAGRHAWLQLIEGQLEVNGQSMATGDACRVSDERRLTIKALKQSEFLLFDLA